jgi:hypothetical protein
VFVVFACFSLANQIIQGTLAYDGVDYISHQAVRPLGRLRQFVKQPGLTHDVVHVFHQLDFDLLLSPNAHAMGNVNQQFN